MTSFRFLKLPFLVQESVLLYLNCADLVDFSFCSKRCQQIAQNIRHRFTHINVKISRHNRFISLMSDTSKCGSWAIDWKRDLLPNRIQTINGQNISVKKVFTSMFTFNPLKPEIHMKIVLEYLMETFKLKIKNVEVRPGDFNYREYVCVIGECDNLQIWKRHPMASQDYQWIVDTIKISGELQSNVKFND